MRHIWNSNCREREARGAEALRFFPNSSLLFSTPFFTENFLLYLLSVSNMLCILLGVLALHLLVFILLIVSTASSQWTVEAQEHTDLWYNCHSDSQGYRCSPASTEDWIQAVQALMILAVVFCFVSLLAFAYQLFRLFKGGRFYFTSIFQILASVFVMCAAIIYTVMRRDSHKDYGYSYVLAWVAFPLSLISGLIYLILRKKD